MDWSQFLDYAYPAIMSGIIAYAFQMWYSHKFDKKLKSFENELETLKDKNWKKRSMLLQSRDESVTAI